MSEQSHTTGGFDITQQKALADQEDEGTIVYIKGMDDKPMMYTDAEGKEQPVQIVVAGAHSRRYRRAEQILRDRKVKPGSFTGTRIHEDTIFKTAFCTLSWIGFYDKGVEYECNQKNAEQLYEKCEFVLDQVSEAMHDHERFFKSFSGTQ